jgi:hypothetical protein
MSRGPWTVTFQSHCLTMLYGVIKCDGLLFILLEFTVDRH